MTVDEDDDICEGKFVDAKSRPFTYKCKDEESAHPKLSRRSLDNLKQQPTDDEDNIDLEYFKFKKSLSPKREINLDESQTVSSQNSLGGDSPRSRKRRTIAEEALEEEAD